MQFLAISRMLTDKFTDSQIAPYLDEEAQTARRVYIEGHLRQIWYRGDRRGAVSLFEAVDEAAVRAHLAALPLVKAGILEVEQVIPLVPYRGFGPR